MKFNSIYSSIAKTGQDLSNEFEDVYEEIPPYSVDLQTGELLNKTPNPIIRKVGKRNVQEQIQSFADDVNLYKILERVAVSGDTSLLNRKVAYFGDYVNLPDNLNDFNDFCKKVFDDNKNVSKDLLDAAINSSLGSAELESIIKKHVEQAVIAAQANNTKGDE